MATALGVLVLALASAQAAVRGLPQEQLEAYVQSTFRCRDGSAELPAHRLNDEYCDCADGSDEPGTSACALGHFYCANVGYKPTVLPSSRVDDGICDCCDGSDEAGERGARGCVDECAQVGAEYRRVAAERAAAFERGLARAREYVAQAAAARQQWESEIGSKKAAVEEAKAKLSTLTEQKEEAEEVERQMQEVERKRREEEEARLKAAEEEAAAKRAGELELLHALRSKCEEVATVDEEAVAACPQLLRDLSGEQCATWSQAGECATNPDFMLKECAASCTAAAAAAPKGDAPEGEFTTGDRSAGPTPVCFGQLEGEGGKEFGSRCHALAAGFVGECESLIVDGPCVPLALIDECDCAKGTTKGDRALPCHCRTCGSVTACAAPQCEVCGPPNDSCNANAGKWGCYGLPGQVATGESATETAGEAAVEEAPEEETGATPTVDHSNEPGHLSEDDGSIDDEPADERAWEAEHEAHNDDDEPAGEAFEHEYDDEMYRRHEWEGEHDYTIPEDDDDEFGYHRPPDEDEDAELPVEGLPTDAGAGSGSAPSESGDTGGWLGWVGSRAQKLKNAATRWLSGGGSTKEKGDTPSHPEADRLRAEHKKAQDAVNSAQRSLDETTKLLRRDFGPDNRFFPLQGQCFSWAPGGEFSYELCPFDKATQSGGTTLGTWKGFGGNDGNTDYSVFEFGGGAHCWATGSGRTAVADVQCAADNTVVSVDEPSVCHYVFVFGTPAACTQALVNEARAEAGLPPVEHSKEDGDAEVGTPTAELDGMEIVERDEL